MTTYTNIKAEYDAMLARGTIPVIEEEINNGDYCLAYVSIDRTGVVFDIEVDGFDELDIRFSDDIEGISYAKYKIPFDEYFDDLQYYLERVMGEINEGLLIPNGLMV